jgi:hypothetical protein
MQEGGLQFTAGKIQTSGSFSELRFAQTVGRKTESEGAACAPACERSGSQGTLDAETKDTDPPKGQLDNPPKGLKARCKRFGEIPQQTAQTPIVESSYNPLPV